MNQPKNIRIQKDLDRIVAALNAGSRIYRSRPMENLRVHKKSGGDAVTDAELEVNQLLFEMLVQEGDGGFPKKLSITRIDCGVRGFGSSIH
jgi:hypothetical protein